jgi:hypothetical protein
MPEAASREASEGVSGVLRDAAAVDEADGVEHDAAVFVEDGVFAHGLTNDFEADALGFEGRGVGAEVGSFDGGVVHEVHLDEADAPVVEAW